MKSQVNIAICGGDARLLSAAACFVRDGHRCSLWKCAPGEAGGAVRQSELRQAVAGADALILPVPAFSSAGRLNAVGDPRCTVDAGTLFSALTPETKIFAGKVSKFVRRIAEEYNLSLRDYAEEEDFSIRNAVPTAEAAIRIAMERLPVTVAGSRFSVIGYGRVAKALAVRLRALQGEVTVAARSSAALASAESDGCRTIPLTQYLADPLPDAVCFNTVPAPIIHDECAARAEHTLFVDLASFPGGFSDEARGILGERLIPALSLPGKYSPQTAGEIIYKTVADLLKKEDAGI